MKKFLLLLSLVVLQVQADIRIANVKAEPIGPWGKVAIRFSAKGTLPNGSEKYMLCVAMSNRVTHIETEAISLSGDLSLSLGDHVVSWDLSKDGIASNADPVNFIVRYVIPLYLVVDLSGGTTAKSYSITGLSDMPTGGWTDRHKTNKLILRRIEPGSFILGKNQSDENCRVDVTNAFYLGVFEVTQRQLELVMGTRPSYFSNDKYYATRPVESVSYSMVRGSAEEFVWSQTKDVSSSSFLAKLRQRTLLYFDLPTEAQWEYACRAGTTTDVDIGLAGRYRENGGCDGLYDGSCAPSGGTAIVGSYIPNAWGLYDMRGNVLEWCLDISELLTVSDRVNIGEYLGQNYWISCRVLRGGYWCYGANGCLSSSRWIMGQNLYSPIYPDYHKGFRLAITR